MKEKSIHGLLVVTTLLYWIVSKGWAAHFWESVAPWGWMICLIVIWHAIIACRRSIEEVRTELNAPVERRSPVLMSTGGYATTFEPPENVPFYRAKITGIASSLICLALAASYMLFAQSRLAVRADSAVEISQTPAPALAPTALYMHCEMDALPVRLTPNSTAEVIPLNHHRQVEGHNNWGFYSIPNRGDKETLWPDKRTLMKVKFNPGAFMYKCNVSNHGPNGLIDVVIPLNINYFSQQKETLTYSAVVSPLDAGSTFTFYVVNDCPDGVSAIQNDSAVVQVLGEIDRRKVPLHRYGVNPIEPIMVFFGSKVNWTNDPCS